MLTGRSPQPSSRRHNALASSVDSGVTATAAALETRLLEGAVAQLQAQVHELQVREPARAYGATVPAAAAAAVWLRDAGARAMR
jgi:hypothetical protein